MRERPSDFDGYISFGINFYNTTVGIIGGGMDA